MYCLVNIKLQFMIFISLYLGEYFNNAKHRRDNAMQINATTWWKAGTYTAQLHRKQQSI